MPQVDFTLEDLKQVFATKDDIGLLRSDLQNYATKDDLKVGFAELSAKIDDVKQMLEEDILAESMRLDRVDRRSAMTLKLLREHKADTEAHGGWKKK